MRLLALVTLLLALAVVPAAGAAPLDRWVAGSSSRVWLEDGTGVAVLSSRDGAILGSIGRGRIVVVDSPRGSETDVDLSDCNVLRHVDRRTTMCQGRDISFSVVDGAWRVTLRGSDIDASAVARGSLRLHGRRGRYQIDDGAKRRWPRIARTFRLG